MAKKMEKSSDRRKRFEMSLYIRLQRDGVAITVGRKPFKESTYLVPFGAWRVCSEAIEQLHGLLEGSVVGLVEKIIKEIEDEKKEAGKSKVV